MALTKPDRDAPLLQVLQHSEAFSAIWSDLAAALGCGLDVLPPGEVPSPSRRPFATVMAVGGAESEAFPLLQDLRDRDVAVVGAEPDHRLTSAMIRAGAGDYFALPGDLGALHAWLEERADDARARDRSKALADQERDRYDFARLIGRSEGLERALSRAARIIPRGSATVLLTGETGTGKELLAQAIHYNGPRAAAPLIEVNCTALPETLLEAELFGYERGAFTGADAAKPGLLEAAHEGTLFLDELGDLSLSVQAKLLKALEEKRVRRLGSLRDVDVDVRIIAATHVDLAGAVRQGTFREDLYYRLSVLPIHLPPLRDRGDDVLLLAEHFSLEAGREYGVTLKPLSESTRAAILRHPWPGNVRELRNAIHRAVLLGDGELSADELFLPGPREIPAGGALPFPATIRELEVAAVRLALEQTGGNKKAASHLLGISRTRLYRLLELLQEAEGSE